MSIFFTNIRSVLKKRDELCAVLDSSSADVVVLTETWLSATVRNSEIFDCQKRFNVYRSDRQFGSGGGVLIAVADCIVSYCVNLALNIEFLCVCFEVNYKKVILCVCYRPPKCTSSFVNELHDAINIVVTRFPNSPIFLLGDFNYPNICWSHESPFPNPFSSECFDFLNRCSDFNCRS